MRFIGLAPEDVKVLSQDHDEIQLAPEEVRGMSQNHDEIQLAPEDVKDMSQGHDEINLVPEDVRGMSPEVAKYCRYSNALCKSCHLKRLLILKQ